MSKSRRMLRSEAGLLAYGAVIEHDGVEYTDAINPFTDDVQRPYFEQRYRELAGRYKKGKTVVIPEAAAE